jgi:transposase-like protein
METNLVQLIDDFHSENKCRAYLEELRWPENIHCPRCQSKKISRIQERDQFDCDACRYQFSVTSGTIFHDTHLPLWKWFLAVYMMCESKKSVSALQLKRTLGVAYKTAWYLCHRIRAAMDETGPLNGIIEVDETYVGGKRRGCRRGRGAAGKTPVAGMIERGGAVRMKTLSYVDAKSLLTFIEDRLGKNVKMVITDELKSYNRVGRLAKHRRINHSKEYVHGDIHTNSIENVWSLLKRSLIGSYHKVSAKHLPAYVNEVGFRFNHRDNPYLFRDTMSRLLNHQNVKFEQLTANTH